MRLEQKLISEKAYELWKAAGEPEGRSEEFWLEAEEMVIPRCPIHNAKMTFIETYVESNGTCENYWTCWQDCEPVDTPNGKVSYRCSHRLPGNPYEFYSSENAMVLSTSSITWVPGAIVGIPNQNQITWVGPAVSSSSSTTKTFGDASYWIRNV